MTIFYVAAWLLHTCTRCFVRLFWDFSESFSDIHVDNSDIERLIIA